MNRLYAIAVLASPLALAAGATQAAYEFAPIAEVTLSLGDPANLKLTVTNPTDNEAKDVRYWVKLWNVDNLGRGDPLGIPDGAAARLRPHRTSAPVRLFDTPSIRAKIKRGDRIIGSISVHCANCARGRSYRVYVNFGVTGWFVDAKDETSGAPFVPRGFEQDSIGPGELKETLLSWIAVENEQRIPIAPATK